MPPVLAKKDASSETLQMLYLLAAKLLIATAVGTVIVLAL